MKKYKPKKIFFITALLLPSLAFSQGKSGPTDKFELSLGAGVITKNNIRKNNNHRHRRSDFFVRPFPFIQMKWKMISLGANGLSITPWQNKEAEVFFNLNREGDRYDGTGMAPRYESFFAGGGLRFRQMHLLLSKDISGHSNGTRLSLHYARMFFLGPQFMIPSTAGVECFDHRYADYYYGVKNSEATIARNEYHPSAYCRPLVSILPLYRPAANISLMSGFVLKYLTSELQNSPTVRKNDLEFSLLLGSSYKF